MADGNRADKGAGEGTEASSEDGAEEDPDGSDPVGSCGNRRGSHRAQRAGEKRFSVVVQLLETRSGERLIRFAYTTAGSARRGPVTMRARDLERLRAALERAPVLGEALRLK